MTIKSCPLCGKEGRMVHLGRRFAAACSDWNCIMGPIRNSLGEGLREWNQRQPAHETELQDALRAELKKRREELQEVA